MFTFNYSGPLEVLSNTKLCFNPQYRNPSMTTATTFGTHLPLQMSSCVATGMWPSPPPPAPMFPAHAKADAERDGWNKAVEVCARLADGSDAEQLKSIATLFRSLRK